MNRSKVTPWPKRRCPAVLEAALRDPSLSYVDVARKLGYRMSYVRRWSGELKLGWVRSGRRPNRPRFDLTVVGPLIERMFAERKTLTEVGAALNTDRYTAGRLARKVGVRFPRGPWPKQKSSEAA